MQRNYLISMQSLYPTDFYKGNEDDKTNWSFEEHILWLTKFLNDILKE